MNSSNRDHFKRLCQRRNSPPRPISAILILATGNCPRLACSPGFSRFSRASRLKPGRHTAEMRIVGPIFSHAVTSVATLLNLMAGALLLSSCSSLIQKNAPIGFASFLASPEAPEMNRRAPETFHVRFETSKGVMLGEVHRDWSPHGADRFYNLVRAGYYDQVRFHRVRQGQWAQFGIHGDPKISQLWRNRTIPDDPRHESNVRGTLAFAFAVPNGRATQVFVNLRDNSSTHDGEPFVPFGKITEGMEVADALNAEYGESAGGGIRGGKQEPLFEMGNAYLEQNFARLDYIVRAIIVSR